jgi:RNA polymerase sigma factor (TIGR02999 family)
MSGDGATPMSSGPEPIEARGDGADSLFGEVYSELKRMAHGRLAGVRDAALDTTELVHELYLRMGHQHDLEFAQRAQFFAYAARAMRHLLLDRARDFKRLRAGGDWQRVTLDADDAALAIDQADEALAIEEALTQLAATDARAARVLELRYFAGLSIDQTAEVLGVAPRSVDRDWQFARAFLHDLLSES